MYLLILLAVVLGYLYYRYLTFLEVIFYKLYLHHDIKTYFLLYTSSIYNKNDLNKLLLEDVDNIIHNDSVNAKELNLQPEENDNQSFSTDNFIDSAMKFISPFLSNIR